MDIDIIDTTHRMMTPYYSLLSFVCLSLVGSVLGLTLLFKLLSYLQARRGSYVLLTFLRHLKRPLYFLIPTLVITIFTPILELRGPVAIVGNLIQAALIVFFTWLVLELIWISEAVFNERCSKGVSSSRVRTLKTQTRFISRLLVMIVLVVMVAVFLMTFQNAKRLGMGLLTSAGIMSVILGLAAQKTLGGVLAGFQIAFNRKLRIDDGVMVEGQWGQVEEISLTHVVVKLLDNRRLVMPINYFMEKPYQNWTLSSSEILCEVMLHVDYGANIEALRHELERILQNNVLWDRKVKTVQVTDTTDKCMIVRVTLSARTAQEVSELCCEVREKLMHYLYHNDPKMLPKIRSETTAKSS